MSTRTFTEVLDCDGKKTSGTYKGRYPIHAAKKIATKNCQIEKGQKQSKQIFVKVKDTRQPNKIYHYVCTKVMLDQPKTIARGGSNFQVKSQTRVKKYKEQLVPVILL